MKFGCDPTWATLKALREPVSIDVNGATYTLHIPYLTLHTAALDCEKEPWPKDDFVELTRHQFQIDVGNAPKKVAVEAEAEAEAGPAGPTDEAGDDAVFNLACKLDKKVVQHLLR